MIHQRTIKVGAALLVCLIFSKIYSVKSMPTSTDHDFEHETNSPIEFIGTSTVPSIFEEQTSSTEFSPSEGETTPSIVMTPIGPDVTTAISMTEGTTLSTADVTEVVLSTSTENFVEKNQFESTDAPTSPVPEENEPLSLVKTESPEVNEGTTVSPDVTTEIIIVETIGTEVQTEVTETSEALTTTEVNSGPPGVGTEAPEAPVIVIVEDLSSDSSITSAWTDGSVIVNNNNQMLVSSEEQEARVVSFAGEGEILSTTLSAEMILETTDNFVVNNQGVISTSGVILNNFE